MIRSSMYTYKWFVALAHTKIFYKNRSENQFRARKKTVCSNNNQICTQAHACHFKTTQTIRQRYYFSILYRYESLNHGFLTRGRATGGLHRSAASQTMRPRARKLRMESAMMRAVACW